MAKKANPTPAPKPKPKIKVAAGNGGGKMRLPPRAKGVGTKQPKRDKAGRFA